MRVDGRIYIQLRPYSVEYGIIQEQFATGSCRWNQGSEVLATVYGPNQPRYSRHEMHDRLTVSCKIVGDLDRMNAMKDLGNLLSLQLANAIHCEKYPRMCVHITVHVTKCDGSLAAIAFNSCIIALIDSGISMSSTPLATCIAFRISNHQEIAYLDPITAEEAYCHSSVLIITKLDPFSGLETLSASKTNGSLTIDQIVEGSILAMNSSSRLRDFIRNLFK